MKNHFHNSGPKTVFQVTNNGIFDHEGNDVEKINGRLVSCQAFTHKNIFELRFTNETCGWFALRVSTKSCSGRIILLSLASQATLRGEIFISVTESETKVVLVNGTSATLLPQVSYPAERDLRLLEPVLRGILISDLHETFNHDTSRDFEFMYDSINGRNFLLLQGSELQKESKRKQKRELSRVF